MTDNNIERITRTEYLENKYLGDGAIIKKPIDIPRRFTRHPFFLQDLQRVMFIKQIKNFYWQLLPPRRGGGSREMLEWQREEYDYKLYSKTHSSIIGINNSNVRKHKFGKPTDCYTTIKYTNKELKKIIDKRPKIADFELKTKNPYKTNSTKKELWKIILSY